MTSLPPMPETAAYILRNSSQFGFRELSEDQFVDRAKSAILTRSGKDGRFLTRAPLDFFLSKSQDTMRPGSVIRDWGIKKEAVGKSRPVIVLSEDYPGMPIDQVAVLFEYQARLLHKLEADENRAGPSLNTISDYPPRLLTLINDDDKDDLMESLERQSDMHATYRKKVVSWLRRRALANTKKVGFDQAKGRVSGTVSPSMVTGLQMDAQTVMIIEIESKGRIKRPEIAVALDLQADINQLEYQTMLCSATPRRMLLYVSLNSPEQRNGAIQMIRPLLQRMRGSDGTMSTNIVEKDSRRSLYPLSLYILPPPSKTSSSTRGMFSHNLTGMGHAIVPIGNDEFDFYYDAHPLVVSYNIGKYVSSVTSFLRSCQALNPKNQPLEANITIVESPKMMQKYEQFRTRSLKIVESLPEDDTELTFTIPYGRGVVIRARKNGSEMMGFTDKSARAGILQLRQIESLMKEGDELYLYGKLSALPNNDPDLPRQLLNFESDDWEGAFLHLVGELSDNYESPPQYLLEANVAPIRSAKGSILPVYEDEIANGNAETLGYVLDGKAYYYTRTYRIRATVLAIDTTSKRFANKEFGTALLGVMTEERRRRPEGTITGMTSSSRPMQTVYESIGKVSSMKGFTVEDRRALYKHLIEFSTHTDGNMLFIDPVRADLIVEVEFTKTFLRNSARFVRKTELTKQTDRFATDANKEASLRPMRYKDPVTGKMRTERTMPVLPVSQQAMAEKKVHSGFVETGFAMLVGIEERTNPQIEDGKIVGIRSAIPGLTEKVDPETVLTAKTEYETNDGLVFFSDIGLDQFKINGPEPYFTGEPPTSVEGLQTLSINPPGGNFSRHRQIEPWRFKKERGKSRLRTYNLDEPREKGQAENFIGWNSRYNGYEGARAIVAPLRDDVKNWAIQSILIPKKYGLRRTSNEIRLDSLEAPKWYQKEHPEWKQPTVEDIIETSEPKFRAFVEASDSPKQMAIAANPPVFESPEAMDMGIQYGDKTGPNPEGKASSSKWHNQTLDGKGKPSSLSDIPWEALAWKTGGFLSEIGMHSKTHEDGTHTVGFLEKFADDPRPYIVSLKIDGDSSLAHFDGKKTVIWNKRGRWRRDFHITDQITTSLKKKGVKSAKIMGELYAVGDEGETLPLNEISSIIVSPKTIDRQKQIRFAGFDIVELDGENLSEAPYENRVSKVDGLLEGDGIMTVPFFHSKGGMKDVQKAWDEGMKEPNFEGLVLRFEGMAKSHKIKMKGTADLAVIGFYRGKSPGRLENSVGGAMLAWMLPNGDFVYAGKSVIGKSDKEKEKMVSELLEEKVEAPVFKIGGRSVDSSKTHINGRGTFTMVKPWKVSEHDYRSINWGKKPVFRFSKGKVEIVGEMNAPTMFQPSFKRWRDDKSINAHDLRIEQVPMEGTGKWGQVKA